MVAHGYIDHGTWTGARLNYGAVSNDAPMAYRHLRTRADRHRPSNLDPGTSCLALTLTRLSRTE